MTGERAPKAYLSRRYRFAASHRLHTEALDREGNAAAYGKCNNPHVHGHNYVVEVTFSGPVDLETGMVTNLTDVDQFARRHLLDRFACSNLNQDPAFADVVPTTENLLREIVTIFRAYPLAHLERVRIEETSNNSFSTGAGGGPDPKQQEEGL